MNSYFGENGNLGDKIEKDIFYEHKILAGGAKENHSFEIALQNLLSM